MSYANKKEEPTTEDRTPRKTAVGETLSIKAREDDDPPVPKDTNLAVLAYASATFKKYT